MTQKTCVKDQARKVRNENMERNRRLELGWEMIKGKPTGKTEKVSNGKQDVETEVNGIQSRKHWKLYDHSSRCLRHPAAGII
jgi:hypothetical protein